MPDTELRQQPHCLDAERAVLGCILLDNTRLPVVERSLKTEHFYDVGHRAVFDSMRELAHDGVSIDPVLLCERLERSGKLDMVGGLAGIFTLEAAVLSTANVASHARVVIEKAVKRQLIRAADTMAGHAYAEENPATALLADAEASLRSLQREAVAEPERPLAHDVAAVVADIEEHTTQKPDCVFTGYPDLDDILGGYWPGDLAILAARTSVGKTSLALNIVRELSIRQRKPTMFFSLEMTTPQVIRRLMALHGNLDLAKLRDPRGMPTGWVDRVQDVARAVADAPIKIIDPATTKVGEIASAVRAYLDDQPDLKLIVVDYLQLADPDVERKQDTQTNRIGAVSKGLKAIAKSTGVPVLALSQLSRNDKQHQNRKPVLSDLRDSGNIEQDANSVLFLHTPADRDKLIDQYQVEALVRKNRDGRIGDTTLLFNGPTTKFM